MVARSDSSNSLLSDAEKQVNKKLRWATSPSHLIYHFGSSGASVAVATACTHPLDVIKVRLQMQLVGQKGPLNGMGDILSQIMKNDGPKGLYLGLTPALTRSVLYGGLRLGLYEPSKYVCNLAFGSTNIFVKIASGAFAGALATALTNPTEVLKVRLQMNTKLGHRGTLREIRKIVSEEGVGALWKGVGPGMTRAAALTASQLATYDESKRFLTRWTNLEEGIYLHLMYVLDFIMHMQSGFQVAHTEGLRGLYKGGFTVFARLGPQTTITFILCEKLRKLAGLNAI
ncbi:Mitochondrial substrate carrier family protein ucpB [Linum perenne]